MDRERLLVKKNTFFKSTWNTPEGTKIVRHPILGKVDVCPFPLTHYDELVAEAKRLQGTRTRPKSRL